MESITVRMRQIVWQRRNTLSTGSSSQTRSITRRPKLEEGPDTGTLHTMERVPGPARRQRMKRLGKGGQGHGWRNVIHRSTGIHSLLEIHPKGIELQLEIHPSSEIKLRRDTLHSLVDIHLRKGGVHLHLEIILSTEGLHLQQGGVHTHFKKEGAQLQEGRVRIQEVGVHLLQGGVQHITEEVHLLLEFHLSTEGVHLHQGGPQLEVLFTTGTHLQPDNLHSTGLHMQLGLHQSTKGGNLKRWKVQGVRGDGDYYLK